MTTLSTSDRQAAEYLSEWDRVHATITTHAAECRRIAEKARLHAGGRVLDLACGTGQHLIEFARRGHPSFGVDQLCWKLARARRQTAELGLRVLFACGDLRSLRLQAVHHLVMCLYAMSMMRSDEDLLAALDAARAALAPGGRFVFNVLAADQPADDSPSDIEGDGHLRSYDPEEMNALLARSGLALVDLERRPIPGFDSTDLHYVCSRQEDA